MIIKKEYIVCLFVSCLALSCHVKDGVAQDFPIKNWQDFTKATTVISKIDAQWKVTLTQKPDKSSKLDLVKYEQERAQANKQNAQYINPDEVTQYEVNAQKAGILGFTSVSRVRLLADGVKTTTTTNAGPKIFPGYVGGPLPIADYVEFFDDVNYIHPLSYTAPTPELKVSVWELNRDKQQALAAAGANGVFGQAFMRLVPLSTFVDPKEFVLESDDGFTVSLLKKADDYSVKIQLSRKSKRVSSIEVFNSDGSLNERAYATSFKEVKNGVWLPSAFTEEAFFVDKVPQVVTEFEIGQVKIDDDVQDSPMSFLKRGYIINDRRFGDDPTKSLLFAYYTRIPTDEEVAAKLAEQSLIPNANNLPRAEDDPTSPIGVAKPTVAIGQQAPDFSVVDESGKQWKLSDLRGKRNVLLTFFPKCFTGGCANHLSSIRDQQSAFDLADTQVFAVSVDSADGPKGQNAFSQQWKFQFPLIPDTGRELGKLYGAVQNDNEREARMSVLIDKTGVVRWIDTDVHVKTHGADVLAKIKQLGLTP